LLGILSIQWKNQTRSTKWHSAINLSMRLTYLPPWSILVF